MKLRAQFVSLGLAIITAVALTSGVSTQVNPAGDGRIYEIFYTASDGRGGTCSGSVFTGVPHDQGGRSVAIDSNVRWNSITGKFVR